MNHYLLGHKDSPHQVVPRNKWEKNLSYDLTHLKAGNNPVKWVLKIYKAVVYIDGSKKPSIVPIIKVTFLAGEGKQHARKKAGIRVGGDNRFGELLGNMEGLKPKIKIISCDSASVSRRC